MAIKNHHVSQAKLTISLVHGKTPCFVEKIHYKWPVSSMFIHVHPFSMGKLTISLCPWHSMTIFHGQVENIRRFGGSTSPAMPWPAEEHLQGDGAEDKLDRLEKIILRATKMLGVGRMDIVNIYIYIYYIYIYIDWLSHGSLVIDSEF